MGSRTDLSLVLQILNTVNPVLSGHSKRDQKLAFKTHYRLMQVKSIAECSHWSILQYFRPSLSYHFSLRFLFCLFLIGRFRQVLLYSHGVLNLKFIGAKLYIGVLLCEPYGSFVIDP